jgi:hypothetical protein
MIGTIFRNPAGGNELRWPAKRSWQAFERNPPMRVAFAMLVLILIALAGAVRADPPGIGPSASADRNEANWADWDAQARITEGDYDGAVQAAKRAEAKRQQADREELAARTVKKP